MVVTELHAMDRDDNFHERKVSFFHDVMREFEDRLSRLWIRYFRDGGDWLEALAFANATIEAETLFWTIAAWILANSC